MELRGLCMVLWGMLSGAAVAEETFQQQAERVFRDHPQQEFLSITSENDLFGAGTDRNYTNGIRFGWLDTSSTAPKIARWIDRYLPLFTINETTAVYYSLGQNLYTPRDITARVPNPNDRPYAAYLYGSVGLSTLEDNHLDRMELTLGVVGPWALGKPTQKFVHRLIDSDDPKGWDYQLENEPGVTLSTQRMWPELLGLEFGPFHFRTSPYVGATLGNVYTYANTGLVFQLVPAKYKWQGLPPRVRPAMPGSGYFAVPENSFAWQIFAGVEGRLMGRNIFLDGNSFRDGPSVDKRHLVGDANAGVAFTYGRTQITYTINWRSKEFHNQDGADVFGAVGLGYRF